MSAPYHDAESHRPHQDLSSVDAADADRLAQLGYTQGKRFGKARVIKVPISSNCAACDRRQISSEGMAYSRVLDLHSPLSPCAQGKKLSKLTGSSRVEEAIGSRAGRLCRITTLFSYGLATGGPGVMVNGWIFVSFFTMFVALSMAEITSAVPASGG